MPKKKTKAKSGRYSKAFTADQLNTIVNAYKKGGTLEELADKYKCSTSKIRNALLSKKVTMRPRGPKGDLSKPKAKKVSKPKAKKVSKPKAKKPKAVNVKISAPKVKVTVVKPAAKKAKPKNSGLAKALSAVAAANPAPTPTANA